MGVFVKTAEKVLKSLLAVVLTVSFCPPIPTREAQAQKLEDSGEPVASAQVADEGGAEAINPDSENSAPTVESSFVDNSGISLQASKSGDSIADWFECGTCEWMIDSSGCLTIRPVSGSTSGELANWEDLSAPWSNRVDSITSVKVMDGVKAKTAEGMFYRCWRLTSIDLRALDTSTVEDASRMFYGCSCLKSLDASGWDTSAVRSMNCMFYGC